LSESVFMLTLNCSQCSATRA